MRRRPGGGPGTGIESQLETVQRSVADLSAKVAQSEYSQPVSPLAPLNGIGTATDNVLTDLALLAGP